MNNIGTTKRFFGQTDATFMKIVCK